MDKTQKIYSDYCDWYLHPNGATNSRIAWQNVEDEAQKSGVSMDTDNLEWPHHVRVGVGKFLFDIILKDIKIDINCVRRNCKEKHYLPAFYTLFRTKGKRLKEEVRIKVADRSKINFLLYQLIND